MRKRTKVIWRILAVVLIIVLFSGFLGYRYLRKSLPKTSGTIKTAILLSEVHVYRDKYGVPHIFAESEKDLFTAAGYVTAQDRLWQMDFNRRVATGRLSEILGAVTLASDKYLRLWGFGRIAEEVAPTLSQESRNAFQWYADGINAFIRENSDNLPPEFSLLNYDPEEWRIEDSIAYARLIAWKLSMSWYVDPVLSRLVEKFGMKKAQEIFPDFPSDAPTILPTTTEAFWTRTENFIDAGREVQDLLGSHGARLGSNSWVVSGEKSVCGKPLLANDPHLTLGAPSVWYEMHLNARGIDVAGVSFPGIPGVVIGHNRDIAWGLTNGMIDDCDFYVERLNPENSNQYWTGDAWQDFESVTETISVKDDTAHTFEIKMSRNGPVVSGFHPSLDDSSEVVTMKWVGQQASDELAAYLKMYKATSWQEFTQSLKHYKVPTQNFVFAARNGDIGYYLGGAVPVRHNAVGILPLQGWTTTGQWSGTIPFDELPHLLNPPENYIATANNKIVDDRYPYYISNLWEPPSRVTRIRQLLEAKEKFTLQDFKQMQQDVTSVHAQTVLPVLLSDLKIHLEAAPDEKLQTYYDLLEGWNGREDVQSEAASIFHAWFLKLVENTLKDEMGEELYGNYTRLANVPNRVLPALLRKETSDWFDDVSTERIESRRDIVVKSLFDGIDLLRDLAGDEISDWAWGTRHTQILEHPLGKRQPLSAFLNIGPFQRGGSTMTINNAEYKFADPFQAYLGPSTRQLVDLCDVDKAESVIPGGQSGQPLSDHYQDQMELWLQGEYHSMSMSEDAIADSAVEHLVLVPYE